MIYRPGVLFPYLDPSVVSNAFAEQQHERDVGKSGVNTPRQVVSLQGCKYGGFATDRPLEW